MRIIRAFKYGKGILKYFDNMLGMLIDWQIGVVEVLWNLRDARESYNSGIGGIQSKFATCFTLEECLFE